MVSRVAYHGLLSACMISLFARNVFNCCSYFNTSTCKNLWHLTPAYILKLYNGNVDVHTLCKARMLVEPLSVRSGASRFTSETIHNDLDTFIDFIATSELVLFIVCFVNVHVCLYFLYFIIF